MIYEVNRMKYFRLMFVLLLLCGCAARQEEESEEMDGDPIEVHFSSLPDKPGEDDEIFVSANDGIHNEEVWDEFLERTEEPEVCQVTVARYTIEGDVIYELLVHDGDAFVLYTDNSRDSFGSYEGIREEKRNFLYDLAYITNEETTGGVKPYMNRYAFISDEDLKDENEVKAFLDQRFAGEENDMVLVWSNQYLMK